MFFLTIVLEKVMNDCIAEKNLSNKLKVCRKNGASKYIIQEEFEIFMIKLTHAYLFPDFINLCHHL